MYQIFVVEDELLIRQNIRNTIENMQGPFSFCGEASDGEMALSIMQDLMPDILITDIRMPFLDGFGLIKHAKNMMPWLKVVIISGFDDFEYARKAISLGVDQYLLKPVRPQELIKVIGDIAAQIEKDKAGAMMVTEGFDENEVQQALKKHFTQQLVFGEADTGTLLEQAHVLKLDILKGFYQVSIFQFDIHEKDQNRLISIIRKLLSDRDQVLYYFNAADRLTLLLCGNDAQDLNERTYQAVQIIRHELKDICPVITTVIGNTVQRIGSIAGAHKNAVNMLNRVGNISAGQIISVDDTTQITMDILQFNGQLGEDFLQRLSCASVQDIPLLMEKLLDGKDSEQYGSTLIRYTTLVTLLKIAVRSIAEYSGDGDDKEIAEQLSGKYNVFAASGSYETFRDTVEDILKEIIEPRQIRTGDRYSHVIKMAEEYVRENFCNPNISLISVAEHVGMSSAHFSTVFSQHEGQTFIAYLTEMRLEKARKLLTKTNMRLSDIALEIGYNEPNYFSHVFRKSEGMTPKEYRNMKSRQ